MGNAAGLRNVRNLNKIELELPIASNSCLCSWYRFFILFTAEAGFNGQIRSSLSAFNHSPKDANTWPQKTKAARIPNGVLRTS